MTETLLLLVALATFGIVVLQAVRIEQLAQELRDRLPATADCDEYEDEWNGDHLE